MSLVNYHLEYITHSQTFVKLKMHCQKISHPIVGAEQEFERPDWDLNPGLKIRNLKGYPDYPIGARLKIHL